MARQDFVDPRRGYEGLSIVVDNALLVASSPMEKAENSLAGGVGSGT
jgi:hypothetical protein